MIAQLNECVWRATSGGDGDLTVASAITGYYTPAQCANPSAIDGAVYTYRAESDDLSQFESGEAPYDAGTATLKRSDGSSKIYQSSNSGSAVVFSAAPKVRFGASAQSVSGEELLGYVDFAVDGAASVVTLDADLRDFSSIRIECASLTADPSQVEPSSDDYTEINVRLFDESAGVLVDAEQLFLSDGAFANGTSIQNPATTGSLDITLAYGACLYVIPGSVSDDYVDGVLAGNTINLVTYNQVTYSSPAYAVTLKVEAFYFDDSAGDFGAPPNMTSGKIWFYGRRK